MADFCSAKYNISFEERDELLMDYGELNVWCNGIEMKGLLVWFPTDVESVLIIPFLLNSEQQ